MGAVLYTLELERLGGVIFLLSKCCNGICPTHQEMTERLLGQFLFFSEKLEVQYFQSHPRNAQISPRTCRFYGKITFPGNGAV